MKKILLSLSMILFTGVLVAGATGAFFSDTETSTGNTFTAGAIDLKIDNESYVTDNDGVLVASPETSWELSDLGDQLFFNFVDLKPGDVGEDTISIHINDNDSWMCMSTQITGTPENGQTEPEALDDNSDGVDDGELQDELNFVFWADDGDNVLEDDEQLNGVWQGDAEEFMSTSPRIVADKDWNIFTGTPNTPLVGGDDYYIAKAWCFGALGLDPVTQDNGSDAGRSPLTAGTGITCNGAVLDNSTQTDGLVGDIEFYAVQSRNNAEFSCSSIVNP